MKFSFGRLMLDTGLLCLAAFSSQAFAETDFDIKGIKFGMTPPQVKKILGTLGPINERTYVDFNWYDRNDKKQGLAAFKLCIEAAPPASGCKEVYTVAFTEFTGKAFFISRTISGKQISSLKTLASQVAGKYHIAGLEQYAFDNSPYWVLFFTQDSTGQGALVPGQSGECPAFSYGGMGFETNLRVPSSSGPNCPEVAGGMQFTRNGQVKDLADGLDIMATNHRILFESNREGVKRRLQQDEKTRQGVQEKKVDL